MPAVESPLALRPVAQPPPAGRPVIEPLLQRRPEVQSAPVDMPAVTSTFALRPEAPLSQAHGGVAPARPVAKIKFTGPRKGSALAASASPEMLASLPTLRVRVVLLTASGHLGQPLVLRPEAPPTPMGRPVTKSLLKQRPEAQPPPVDMPSVKSPLALRPEAQPSPMTQTYVPCKDAGQVG